MPQTVSKTCLSVLAALLAFSLYLHAAPVASAAPPEEGAEPANEEVAEIDRLDANGFSKLHRAAMTGKPEDVKKLLADGAKVDVRQGKFKGTPLQYAASRGDVKIVQALLKAKAKVDARDTNGRTPLMWAADKGHADAVSELVKAKADLRAVNNGGWTALHYAAGSRHKAAAQLLIDSGAKTDALNSQKKTPLDLAPDLGLKLPAEEPADDNPPAKKADA